jgi:hypothetical protein
MTENESFFRKVVRFVANPATEWTDLAGRPDESRELEVEKSELKAMIERKRRNDFVRKREFDVLRRIRREGLTPEQAAALEGSSRIDDSEVRLGEASARPDGAVKAKIDEIEQQMVGDGYISTRRPPPGLGGAAAPQNVPMLREVVQAAPLAARPNAPTAAPAPPRQDRRGAPEPGVPLAALAKAAPMQAAAGLPPLAARAPASFDMPPAGPAPSASSAPLRPGYDTGTFAPTGPAMDTRSAYATGTLPTPPQFATGTLETRPTFATGTMEVSEALHDAELDEAVIAFANADFQFCEQSLRRLMEGKGPRAQHAETWLVLFDLYRATGLQPQFETLAVSYVQRFASSAPQWYSLPKMVAEALADQPTRREGGAQGEVNVGWSSPERLDTESVGRLRSQTLQLPLPWVFDWSPLKTIEPEAAMQLSTLFRLWSGQAIEMRWLAGDRLFQVLHDAAPTGVRDADPAFWLTRLDALRLANRADQFDEAAIDYCVTYEVSPPSWEPARCKVVVSGGSTNTRAAASSLMSDVSTGFMETGTDEDPSSVAIAHVDLSGQLLGDISATLGHMLTQLGECTVVNVSCARLIRVDFIAAGDLLNWVLARRAEGRAVQLIEAHRLVALFFGAMGINEHARVQIRKV